MSEQPVTKVAVVQAASVIFNAEKTLEKVAKYTKEAADAGAKLVLFPEAFISGYPHFLDFGKPGTTKASCRGTFQRYWESSVEIPGPFVTQLGNIAKTNQIYMVVGVIEKELTTLYCVTIFFDDEGQFLGKHRKLVPTTAERLVWGRGDGSTLPVFDWPMGKTGAVICWENYMPLVRMTMYSKGIQIYLAPNADDTDGWLHSMQHIALEGRCFVLACNQFIRKSDYPADLVDTVDCKDDIVCRGGSVIVSPLGQILAGPNYTSEGILYADLDLAEVIKGKFDLDTTGHYARPDIFTLTVREEKHSNVTVEYVDPQPPKANPDANIAPTEPVVNGTKPENSSVPINTESNSGENSSVPIDSNAESKLEGNSIAPIANVENEPKQDSDVAIPNVIAEAQQPENPVAPSESAVTESQPETPSQTVEETPK